MSRPRRHRHEWNVGDPCFVLTSLDGTVWESVIVAVPSEVFSGAVFVRTHRPGNDQWWLRVGLGATRTLVNTRELYHSRAEAERVLALRVLEAT